MVLRVCCNCLVIQFWKVYTIKHRQVLNIRTPKLCDGSTQKDNCNTATFSFSLQLTRFKCLWGRRWINYQGKHCDTRIHSKFQEIYRLWTLRPHFDANRLWHTVHKYGLCLSSYGLWVTTLLSASVFTSKDVPAYSQQFMTSIYTKHRNTTEHSICLSSTFEWNKCLITTKAVVRAHNSKKQFQHISVVIHILYTVIETMIHIACCS